METAPPRTAPPSASCDLVFAREAESGVCCSFYQSVEAGYSSRRASETQHNNMWLLKRAGIVISPTHRAAVVEGGSGHLDGYAIRAPDGPAALPGG